MLVQLPEEGSSETVEKALQIKAQELSLKVKFTSVSPQDYTHWVRQQGKDRHIITVLGHRLSAKNIAEVTKVIRAQELNIDVITRLSGRIPLEESSAHVPYACVEFSVRGTPQQPTAMRRAFLELAHESGVDIAIQNDNIYRRNRRLVAFDMDSTLIQCEVIDELASAAGVGAQVAEITERAMQGELDYRESLKARLALLKGLDASVMEGIAARLPLTPGAERLFPMLKALGFKTAIISGGFSYFGKHLQQKLGIDYLFANELEIINNRLTGNVVGEIIDAQMKVTCLQRIAEKENISLHQVIAVGDGANDLPMLSKAGLGIAFRAKPKVKESAQHAISNMGLDAILYLIGVRDRETMQVP
jgi:phosphoserine phosphatase